MSANLQMIWSLTRREVFAKFRSIWLYLLISLVCLAAIVFGNGFIRSFETETVLVSNGPLSALNAGVFLLLGLVAGVRLAGSLSWEREHRTLEVLLVGPATHGSVIASKFLAEAFVVLVVLGFYCLFLLLGQPLGRGVLTAGDAASLAAWSVYILPTMALGLLVSSLFSTVRAAVVAFLVFFGLLLLVELSAIWLAPLPPTEMSLAQMFLRSALEITAPIREYTSAIAQLVEPIQITLGRGIIDLRGVVVAFALCALTLGLAILVSRGRPPQ